MYLAIHVCIVSGKMCTKFHLNNLNVFELWPNVKVVARRRRRRQRQRRRQCYDNSSTFFLRKNRRAKKEQEEIISAILDGRDVTAILPTGSCYIAPPLLKDVQVGCFSIK